MQVTALLVAVLLIGTAVAQTTAPTRPPWPGVDVTAKTCLGSTCAADCNANTFQGDVCHTSRRNSSQSEALLCNQAGVIMSLSIYGRPGCDGPTIWLPSVSRRVSAQCNGANACPLRWSSFTYLGNFRLQINFNCTSDCATGCQYATVVDTRSCWSLGAGPGRAGISGTVDSIDAGSWVNADQFVGECSRESVIERNSIEENVCFPEFGGFLSSSFQCERAPSPPAKKV